MIPLLSIIIVLCCSSAWAFSPGFIAAVTSGVSSATSSLYGFPTIQASNLANNNNYQYFFKIPSTLSLAGTLTKYIVTVNDGIPSSSQMGVCLYTHNSSTDRPGSLIANSCVTSSLIGSFPQTLNLVVTGGPSLSSGSQYWIATQPTASATTAGQTASGSYYLYYSGGTPVVSCGTEDATYTGTPGILQIEVTP